MYLRYCLSLLFFFNDTATPEIYTLSLHDALPILATRADQAGVKTCVVSTDRDAFQLVSENVCLMMTPRGVSDVQDRKSTRLNSSHPSISYAVFCLKKKKKEKTKTTTH